MAGRKNFSKLSAQVRERPGADERITKLREDTLQEIADYEATLADVRRARKMTQEQLANALDVSQAQVSRVERQADLHLSTLRSYIEAMGGELVLVARFEGRKDAEIPIEPAPSAEAEPTFAPAPDPPAFEDLFATLRQRSGQPWPASSSVFLDHLAHLFQEKARTVLVPLSIGDWKPQFVEAADPVESESEG
jgi:transcriptional regulator with XRE-family HTH domain